MNEKCKTLVLSEDDIKALFLKAYNLLMADRDTVAADCQLLIDELFDTSSLDVKIAATQEEIRPIVVGRKNWLFCDTQAGANASTTIFTLLETAKANEVNSETYLNHLLDVLPERFANDPQAQVDDLMPWNETMQSRFLA